MKFGQVPVEEAVGALAAHSVRAGETVLKKGTLVSPEIAARLKEAGVATITAVRFEPGDISEDEAPGYVAGFAAALDMTAADIHARNPRYLTRAKAFDTFFSFGSELVTPDELADPLDLEVCTALNGAVAHRNRVFNMRYRPWFAVAFHSRYMTLLPGDILLTGTPGAVDLRDGDEAECRIAGFRPLRNPVVGP